jgi:hypothetical protein
VRDVVRISISNRVVSNVPSSSSYVSLSSLSLRPPQTIPNRKFDGPHWTKHYSSYFFLDSKKV